MSILKSLAQKAKTLKKSTMVVYFAARDPRTPWHAKLVAGMVVAYAFSPIDLIPDFIPVLGLLDDLLIVPIGLAISIRMIPKNVLESARLKASRSCEKHVNYWVGTIIIAVWISTVALLIKLIFFK